MVSSHSTVSDHKDRGKISPEAARKAIQSVIWAPLRPDESIVDRYRYYRDLELVEDRPN